MSDKVTVEAIVDFSDKYAFLSNHFMLTPPLRPIAFDKYWCKSVQHAFEASKTDDEMARKRITQSSSPRIAMMMAKMTMKPSDWEDNKLVIMKELVYHKFIVNESLAMKLVDTENIPLIYGNNEGDSSWGATSNNGTWEGHNHLGKLLMDIRSAFQEALERGNGSPIDQDSQI